MIYKSRQAGILTGDGAHGVQHSEHGCGLGVRSARREERSCSQSGLVRRVGGDLCCADGTGVRSEREGREKEGEETDRERATDDERTGSRGRFVEKEQIESSGTSQHPSQHCNKERLQSATVKTDGKTASQRSTVTYSLPNNDGICRYTHIQPCFYICTSDPPPFYIHRQTISAKPPSQQHFSHDHYSHQLSHKTPTHDI